MYSTDLCSGVRSFSFFEVSVDPLKWFSSVGTSEGLFIAFVHLGLLVAIFLRRRALRDREAARMTLLTTKSE